MTQSFPATACNWPRLEAQHRVSYQHEPFQPDEREETIEFGEHVVCRAGRILASGIMNVVLVRLVTRGASRHRADGRQLRRVFL